MDEKELAQEVLNKVQVLPTKYKIAGACLVVLLIVAIITATILYFKHSQSVEEKNQQAKVMSQQYSTDVNALQKELATSKQNAELLADAVSKAQAGKTQPNTYITVQSPTVGQAANDVANRINNKDSTLPPIALEKTDRTIVVPQEVAQKDGTKDWQVGVYKVNTYKNWYVSTGIGVNDGDVYIPIAMQRNYSKDAAVEVQVNIDPQKQSANGGQIMYKRATNKLLGVF